MGLVQHYRTSCFKFIDEQQSLEGHSLYASSLRVFYSTFATSRIWLFEGLYMYCDYPLYQDRLTYQLALSPSMGTNYDYDLH